MSFTDVLDAVEATVAQLLVSGEIADRQFVICYAEGRVAAHEPGSVIGRPLLTVGPVEDSQALSLVVVGEVDWSTGEALVLGLREPWRGTVRLAARLALKK